MKLHLSARVNLAICQAYPTFRPQCYLPPDTIKHSRLNPGQRLLLDLRTLEGWKAELT